MDLEAMREELARLQQENVALRERGGKEVSFKVSDKGALSVYGLGRFPVTLYKEQWHKLLAAEPQLRQFLRDNDARLKTKGP